jgi:hypothetical protein
MAFSNIYENWHIAVVIATGCRLIGQGAAVQTGFGAHPASYLMSTAVRGLFPEE